MQTKTNLWSFCLDLLKKKKKLEFAREFTLCPITNIRPLLPVLCFDFSHRPLLGY